MKTLPTQFRKGGFDYILVDRIGNSAIYRQTKLPALHECYEVGRIRQNKARLTFGKQIEASESWPNAAEWGRLGWTYRDLRRAKERLATLTPPKR